jgi:hypothetical protein
MEAPSRTSHDEHASRASHGVATAPTEELLSLDVMPARMRSELLPNGRKVTVEQFEASRRSG